MALVIRYNKQVLAHIACLYTRLPGYTREDDAGSMMDEFKRIPAGIANNKIPSPQARLTAIKSSLRIVEETHKPPQDRELCCLLEAALLIARDDQGCHITSIGCLILDTTTEYSYMSYDAQGNILCRDT